MLPTVAEKSQSEGPVVIMQPPAKMTSHKKFMIMAIAAVTVVAILVGGLVTVAYFFKDSSDNMADILSFYVKEKDGIAKETIKMDVSKNITFFDVKRDEKKEFQVINDFKRGLTVFKMGKDGCYIAPLNTSAVMSPTSMEKLKTLSDHEKQGNGFATPNTTEEFRFQPTGDAIIDPSFLGDDVMEMCDGLNVYWLTPYAGALRQKRHSSYTACYCYTYSYYELSYCGCYYIRRTVRVYRTSCCGCYTCG